MNDLFTREVLVRPGQHDLVQACPQEHLEPTENVRIQWLQQARHQLRYERWPAVIITVRSKRALRAVTFMCVLQ